ncbi:MAG TPA: hypothetical protein VFY05_13405 [Candidatus Angelobacter sp.]|nr:hypothetical protein [Candidatus Angelobacter sp.]
MYARTKKFPNLELRLRLAGFQARDKGKSRRQSSADQRKSATFSAGQPVIESGIYEVIHDHAHRTAHEVVMLRGDSFPPCDNCAERVRFRLIRTAPYIFQDEDFGTPE